MPANIPKLFEEFKPITDHHINELENDLPSFKAKEIFQAFGKDLENNLSTQGKSVYAMGLDQAVLTAIHEEVTEKLSKDYKEILDNAKTHVLENFDPVKTANNAKEQLKIKLEASKKLFLERLNTELVEKGQEFTNPADKEALATAFTNYLNPIEKKYENSLGSIESINSLLAKLQLHTSNEESKRKTENKDATFTIKEIDLNKLSTGPAPKSVTGFKVHKDNLSERLMHILANKKEGEKINIELTLPDRGAIFKQMGEIAFQYKTPGLAFIFLLIFYFAMIGKGDEKRTLTAVRNLIEEKGIMVNPQDITLTIKSLNNNGKSVVISEKAALSPESINDFQSSIEKIKNKLKEHQLTGEKNPTLGPESGYNSEESEEDENLVSPRSSSHP